LVLVALDQVLPAPQTAAIQYLAPLHLTAAVGAALVVVGHLTLLVAAVTHLALRRHKEITVAVLTQVPQIFPQAVVGALTQMEALELVRLAALVAMAPHHPFLDRLCLTQAVAVVEHLVCPAQTHLAEQVVAAKAEKAEQGKRREPLIRVVVVVGRGIPQVTVPPAVQALFFSNTQYLYLP
jgi:ATP-dependent exoDNAse (exonuclease V) alpha subunit